LEPTSQRQKHAGTMNTTDDERPIKSATDKIRGLLGCELTCTLDDGRLVTGDFVCLDRLKNILLTNVVEERMIELPNEASIPTKRKLTQAMIPGKHLQQVRVSRKDYQRHATS